MKKPKVSFVIRTKNEGLWIGKVLKLLLRQTFKDFEIIIVDSGSTDRTLKIVKRFPVRLIQMKPEEFNFSYGLNLGISKARGEYIGIINGHSLPISDTWLEDGLRHFRDPRVVGVTGLLSMNPLAYLWRGFGRFDLLSSRDKPHPTKNMTNTNALIRKKMWRLYPFDERLPGAEDYDWACEMKSRGYRVISDRKFSVYHSHLILGRKPRFFLRPLWRQWVEMINKKKRPGESYTRLKLN